MELARRAWQGVANGDAAALAEVWDAKIVWNAAGGHPWSGRFEGLENVLAHIAEIGDSVEQFDAELDEVLTSDRRIVYFFHAHLRRGARTARVAYVMAARHDAGKIHSIWLAPTNPEALAGLWDGA